MPNHTRYDLVLLNDHETPMEFVVRVLDVFFDMSFAEACKHMFRAHREGKAICGTYSREEARKKVADILAFADEHKYPLKCILRKRTDVFMPRGNDPPLLESICRGCRASIAPNQRPLGLATLIGQGL